MLPCFTRTGTLLSHNFEKYLHFFHSLQGQLNESA